MTKRDEEAKSAPNQLRPNTFQTPNLIVDRLMELLKDGELRIVIFACRHIYGWENTNIAGKAVLSVSAFEHGHRGSKGCGLSRQGIIDALESLKSFGIMRPVGEPTPDGQAWALAEHDKEIKWSALETRAWQKAQKRQRQTNRARVAKQKKRTQQAVCLTDQGSSLSNRPGNQSVQQTSGGLLDRPEGGLSNRPGPGLSNRLNETQSLKPNEKPTLETQSTTPDSTDHSSPSDSTTLAGDVVADEDYKFILPEIQKLGLTPDVQERLLALGPQKALAVAFASQKPGVRNPGGLAVSMMSDGGASELDLQRAAMALELRTLDRTAIDEQINRREYAQLVNETQDLVAQKEGQEGEPSGESPPPLPLPASPNDLDTALDGGRLTMRDIWQAARRALELQLNRESYNLWVRDLKALSYADGILTVQARCSTVRDELARHDWLAPAVTRLAGKPIQVRVVLAGEEVRR